MSADTTIGSNFVGEEDVADSVKIWRLCKTWKWFSKERLTLSPLVLSTGFQQILWKPREAKFRGKAKNHRSFSAP